MPNFMRNRPKVNYANYSTEFFSAPDYKTSSKTAKTATLPTKHKYTNSIEIPHNSVSERTSYNTISVFNQSEKTQKSRAMNASTMEIYNNPIIMSDSEENEADGHDDVVEKYKQALEMSEPKKSNAVTPKISAKDHYNNNKPIETITTVDSRNHSYLKTEPTKPRESKITVSAKPRPSIAPQTQYSSEKNKEKLELYNQKIAQLLNSLKKPDVKKKK